MPRKLYLPILALAVEFVFSRSPFPEWAVFPLEYGLLFWFVIVNLRNQGCWPYLIGGGTLFNFAVIALNGFRMPVWTPLLEDTGKAYIIEAIIENEFFGYTLVNSGTRLSFLADIIGVSFYDRVLGFASIGDILLMAGAATLLFRILGNKLFSLGVTSDDRI